MSNILIDKLIFHAHSEKRINGYDSHEEWNEDVQGGALFDLWKRKLRDPSYTDEQYAKDCKEVNQTEFV
tara:strand:+ start:458 stop:664 length:207 start_codon:yes stop_codon:yes gene_type:complete